MQIKWIEEREKHNIPTNLNEIIGPDCQPENVMSFLRSVEMEKYILEKRKHIVTSQKVPLHYYCNQIITKN